MTPVKQVCIANYIDNMQLCIGVIMVVIVIAWWLDLQLHMQSVPVTAKVVRSNPDHGGCTRHNII
jgi:predicted GNAT superfamily acetyltransferase